MKGKKSEKHVKPKEKKKSKNAESFLQGFFVLLLSLCAVATGLSIPGIAAGVQNKRVDKYQREEELEPGALSLTSDDTKIAKLTLARELVNNGLNEFEQVKLENGRFLTESEAKDRLRDVFEIAKDTGLYVGMSGDWQNLHGEPTLFIPARSDVHTGLVWMMESGYQSGDTFFNIQFIVDDSSGLVMAVKIQGPMGMMPENRAETLKKLAENLSAYYAFSDTELVPQDEENMRESKSDDCWIYLKRSGETILEIPVVISDSMWKIG